MTATWIQNGFAPFKRLLPKAVWQPIRSVATAIVAPIRFSLVTGHFRSSLAMSACAANGDPIPWYTYPMGDFLAQRDLSGANVLEFGGGQSTLWWSSRARSVLTIEENAEWHDRLQTQVRGNVSLHHVPVDPVTRDITAIQRILEAYETKTFDVIVVDGHLRAELTALAFDYLAPRGAIILDNAEGYGMYEQVRSRACQRVDFFGFVPGVSLRQCTSLVFVSDCFLLDPGIPLPIIEAVPAAGLGAPRHAA